MRQRSEGPDYYLAKAAEYRSRAQAAREQEHEQRALAMIALEFLQMAKGVSGESGPLSIH